MDPVSLNPQSRTSSTAIQIALICLSWSIGLLIAMPPRGSAREQSALSSHPEAISYKIDDQIAFCMPSDPANQKRWADSLQLNPIHGRPQVSLPQLSLLSDWNSPKPFRRPPYSEDEVKNWWNQHSLIVKNGYIRRFESGGYIVLDLQTDSLQGWLKSAEFNGLFR
jgi:hypothetical protein